MQAPLPVAAHRLRLVLASLSALFILLLVVPVNLNSVLSVGASERPLASLFMTWVNSHLLPPGWTLFSVGPSWGFGGPALLYVEASLALTLIIGYPLIAFVLFERIVPRGAGRYRRTVYTLTALSSTAFFVGVLFALFFVIKFYIVSLPPRFEAGLACDSGRLLSGGAGSRVRPGAGLDPAIPAAGRSTLPGAVVDRA